MSDVERDEVLQPEAQENKEKKEGGEEATTHGEVERPAPVTLDKEVDTFEQHKEYSDEEYDEYAKMYDETLSEFMEGEVVEGRILAIGEKEVAVDVGFKSEGTIDIEEFEDPSQIKVGDRVSVVLDQMEDQDGQLVLSKRKADFMKVWEKVRESYEKGEIIQGKCVRRIKGGMVVDLNGVDAFLPGSQIDVRPIRDFDSFIGKTLDLKVVKVNNIRKNIVVSHRVLVEEEMVGQKQKILANLERGQVLTGTVKNITNFGVFIDLGGVDGLLHINDLSWGRVSHPSEVVSLDKEIKVVVLEFNEEKNRISLGYKQLQPHPWEDVDKKYPVDSAVQGKVVSISDYGAFVELEKGVEGLIHISEMSWTQHIKHPSKILAVGEIVEARVLSVQKEERKISLGLKQLQPDPWETLAERYPINSIRTGTVRNLTNFGAFVELEEGIDGLVHISDLSWTKKVRHPGEIVRKGDQIQVIVMKVDAGNRRISLGFKQTQENPWEKFEETYKPGTLVTGKVVRLIEKGLLVELPMEVDGFIPLSHLVKEGIKKPAEAYKLDDELELCVIEFSKDNKRIVLSEKKALEKLPVAEIDEKTKEEIAAIESLTALEVATSDSAAHAAAKDEKKIGDAHPVPASTEMGSEPSSAGESADITSEETVTGEISADQGEDKPGSVADSEEETVSATQPEKSGGSDITGTVTEAMATESTGGTPVQSMDEVRESEKEQDTTESHKKKSRGEQNSSKDEKKVKSASTKKKKVRKDKEDLGEDK